ncbi:MAG: hypothetical protein EOM34_16165 [Clostridia bacterium]|nr:hypothetical protein [Clostridia bacterium]
MALIKCTECGKEFSDKADACPNCGCPTEKMTTPEQKEEIAETKEQASDSSTNTSDVPAAEKEQSPKEKNPNTKKIIIGVIAAIVVIGVAAFFLTANSRKYSSANTDFKGKKFEVALEKYESLGDYKDSAKKAEECKYELTVDGQFMRALSEGLMARWDKSDENVAKGLVGEDPDLYAEFCQIELDKVSSFADKTFENKKLGEDAKTYIDLLNKAKDATKYYTVDYTTYSTQWADVYAQRTILLQKFISDYNLSVDAAYQETLDDMMVDASAAKEQQEAKETIHKMADGFKLVETKDDYGYKTYKLQMKNTTEFTFDYFSVDISVMDGDGKIVYTGNASQVSTWAPGQDAEVDAYVSSQGDENSTIEGKTIKFTPHYSTGTIYE